jgi:hypothetical protein
MSNLHRNLCCLACVFAIAGCNGSTARTETLDGRFIMATAHRVQVDLQSPGSLSIQKVLLVDPNAKITVAGKTQTLADIPANSKLHITRDLDTHRVIRIEAN